jgi:hypothetical protein
MPVRRSVVLRVSDRSVTAGLARSGERTCWEFERCLQLNPRGARSRSALPVQCTLLGARNVPGGRTRAQLVFNLRRTPATNAVSVPSRRSGAHAAHTPDDLFGRPRLTRSTATALGPVCRVAVRVIIGQNGVRIAAARKACCGRPTIIGRGEPLWRSCARRSGSPRWSAWRHAQAAAMVISPSRVRFAPVRRPRHFRRRSGPSYDRRCPPTILRPWGRSSRLRCGSASSAIRSACCQPAPRYVLSRCSCLCAATSPRFRCASPEVGPPASGCCC